MRIRRTKLMLVSLGVVLLAIGLSAILLAWLLRYDEPRAGALIIKTGAGAAGAHSVSLPPLDDFARLWEVDLRRPLVDEAAPPPAAEQAAAPQTSAFQVHLVGTAVDPGGSFAMLVGSSGTTVVKAVGEQIDGAELVEIREGSVTLRHNGQDINLEVPKREVTTPEQHP